MSGTSPIQGEISLPVTPQIDATFSVKPPKGGERTISYNPNSATSIAKALLGGIKDFARVVANKLRKGEFIDKGVIDKGNALYKRLSKEMANLNSQLDKLRTEDEKTKNFLLKSIKFRGQNLKKPDAEWVVKKSKNTKESIDKINKNLKQLATIRMQVALLLEGAKKPSTMDFEKLSGIRENLEAQGDSAQEALEYLGNFPTSIQEEKGKI